MKSETEIREKLEELDGAYLPEERYGKKALGRARGLAWVLDDDVEVWDENSSLVVVWE